MVDSLYGRGRTLFVTYTILWQAYIIFSGNLWLMRLMISIFVAFTQNVGLKGSAANFCYIRN